jgi:Leucine rich repeat
MITLRRLALAASSLILIAAPQMLAAQSDASPTNGQTKFIFLLEDGFRGWVCVDFDIAGAEPLPRKGDARVIRPRRGQVLLTSDKPDSLLLFGQAWYEINGQRRPLPSGVTLQPGPTRSGPREPTQRSCAFVGTTDERDAAEPPSGFENLRQRVLIPTEERQALEALYKATSGDGWTHRVGWLGPPGTECDWHGVQCGMGRVVDLSLDENNLVGQIPSALVQLSKLQSLDLRRNHLTGTIPPALGRLTDLEWVSVNGNDLSGLLPEPLIQRWLDGPLAISAEAHLFTDVSEIDFESSSSSALCATHRIMLRADESVFLYTERCRNASPDDRTTFCEAKQGHIGGGEFAMLGWLLEKNRFFDLAAEYHRGITEATFENTRVTKGGKIHAVSNYASAGPFELWIIQSTIEGVAASVEWEKTTTQQKCPRW